MAPIHFRLSQSSLASSHPISHVTKAVRFSILSRLFSVLPAFLIFSCKLHPTHNLLYLFSVFPGCPLHIVSNPHAPQQPLPLSSSGSSAHQQLPCTCQSTAVVNRLAQGVGDESQHLRVRHGGVRGKHPADARDAVFHPPEYRVCVVGEGIFAF